MVVGEQVQMVALKSMKFYSIVSTNEKASETTEDFSLELLDAKFYIT